MALFKITSKKSGSYGGIRLEKGMSVEVVCNHNPLNTSQGKEIIRNAFKSKYGQDLKQLASGSFLDCEKLN